MNSFFDSETLLKLFRSPYDTDDLMEKIKSEVNVVIIRTDRPIAEQDLDLNKKPVIAVFIDSTGSMEEFSGHMEQLTRAVSTSPNNIYVMSIPEYEVETLNDDQIEETIRSSVYSTLKQYSKPPERRVAIIGGGLSHSSMVARAMSAIADKTVHIASSPIRDLSGRPPYLRKKKGRS